MDDASRLEALARARIIVDPRKFYEYVLVPEHPAGKDRIFLGMLGFRPENRVDAWALARLYEEQARQRIASGEVQFGETNEYGLRCTMVVIVRDAAMRTGWRFRASNVLWLTTPFSGFVRDSTER